MHKCVRLGRRTVIYTLDVGGEQKYGERGRAKIRGETMKKVKRVINLRADNGRLIYTN